jgi:NodT family efflux transporter outer membrane factor (OMF) lipoprotein
MRYYLLLLFLSGCISMSKEDQAKNLIPTPSIESTVAESLEKPFFSSGPWPDKSWWEIFESKQLNELIETALANNPSIQSVEQTIENARARAVIARSSLFPLVYFNYDDNWQYLSKNGLYRTLNPTFPLNANLVDLSLSFTYEFDFWNKYRNLFRAALGQQMAQEAETAQVKLITTTSVAATYFALKTNLIRLDLYCKLSEVRKKIYELQTLLLENALYSKLPVLLSEEQLYESEKLVYSLQEEVAENKHLINILVGNGPDVELGIDQSLPSLPKNLAIPKDLSLNLISRRPDLMAQIWRVESLAHEVGAAKADFFPNISLSGFLGFETVNYSKLFNSSSKTTGIEPALSLPVYTAGAIQAGVDAKRALFDEAVFEYNNLILQATREVADILVFAISIFEQQQKQEKIVKSSKERYELTILRQQSGLDNSLENFAFQEAVLLKELDNINLIYNEYAAAIKLIKALGGGYNPEFVPIKK